MNYVQGCEVHALKRAWILENFPATERLFCDIKSLKDDKVFNVVTGLEERVPSTDIFVAGFVCKSVSTENNQRKSYKKCIEARMCEVNTSDFLIPQSRNRCWMVGLRSDRFSAADLGTVFQMVELMQWPTAPTLTQYLKQFKVGKCGMPPRTTLNVREGKVLKAALKKVPNRKQQDHVLVDVAKSEQRSPVQLQRAPCLVANSKIYWKNKQRFLSAEEVLALQGIFKADFKAAETKFFTKHRRLCHDLSGNAFSMSVCSAVLIAVLMKLSEGTSED
eukprot:s1569_g2.t1